jgi:hypothetical protein
MCTWVGFRKSTVQRPGVGLGGQWRAQNGAEATQDGGFGRRVCSLMTLASEKLTLGVVVTGCLDNQISNHVDWPFCQR